METIRKIFALACIAVAAFAAIGCTCFLFYFGKPLFAIACICLAGMAVPFVIDRVKELLN